MGKIRTVENSKGRGLRGKLGPVGIVIGTKTVSLLALLVAYYVLVFFLAIRVVPLVFGFVGNGSGVTTSTASATLIAVWIAPSLFLIATLFVLMLVVIRALWRLRSRLVESVSAWAFGREPGVAAAAAPASISKARASRRRKSA